MNTDCTNFFPWGEDFHPVSEEDANDKDWAYAYLIIPDQESKTEIFHQFGDVACYHANFRGRIEKISNYYGKKFDDVMRDMFPEEENVNKVLHEMYGCDCIRCEKVIGQGLVQLSNGRFIMTQGND